MVGSSILARSDSKAGIWREAELGSWDEKIGMGEIVFLDDGSSAKLGPEAMTLSGYAELSDEEESDTGSEHPDSADSEEDISQGGLGFLEGTNLQRGIQTDTAIFAKWENHTRGIASRMMANMGYREGMGLGASGQGMLNPIPVKVLPQNQSLDDAVKNLQNEENEKVGGEKKRSRGGKRKREKKFAEAARAAKKEEDLKPDMFSLINTQLAAHGRALNGGSARKQQIEENGEERKVDRRSLLVYEDEMKELRVQVQRLEEMVKRNRKEKVVYEAAMRKLNETRSALADAEAAHASASKAITSKEKEKKWLKF